MKQKAINKSWVFFALLRAGAYRLKLWLWRGKPTLVKYGGYSAHPQPKNLEDWIGLAKLQCTDLGITTEMIRDFFSGRRKIEQIEQELVHQKKLAKAGQLAPWVRTNWRYVERFMKKHKLAPETLLELYEKTEVGADENRIYPPHISHNPAGREIAIRYKVAKAGQAKLFIFAGNGKLIKTLADSEHTVGEFNVKWDGTNGNGQLVVAGTYFVQADTPSYVASTPFKFKE